MEPLKTRAEHVRGRGPSCRVHTMKHRAVLLLKLNCFFLLRHLRVQLIYPFITLMSFCSHSSKAFSVPGLRCHFTLIALIEKE